MQLEQIKKHLNLKKKKMSKSKLIRIDLSADFEGHKIHQTPEQRFEWESESSTAQFDICPIWRGEKIVEVYIYPVDQPNAKNYYYVKSEEEGFEGIDFEHLHYKYETIRGTQSRINFPIIWKTYWCNEHKTQAIRFYVPRHSQSFFLSRGLEKLCFNWR